MNILDNKWKTKSVSPIVSIKIVMVSQFLLILVQKEMKNELSYVFKNIS